MGYEDRDGNSRVRIHVVMWLVRGIDDLTFSTRHPYLDPAPLYSSEWNLRSRSSEGVDHFVVCFLESTRNQNSTWRECATQRSNRTHGLEATSMTLEAEVQSILPVFYEKSMGFDRLSASISIPLAVSSAVPGSGIGVNRQTSEVRA